MSVRGSKNKVLLYIGGICSIIFVILLYHNASQRLEEVEKSYERCHLNEESLSAQLQVNLEYKLRLEKSLQQEKSEHAQIKEDLQSKLEEERHARERENSESISKFTALQQKYKFLQSQHEDVNLECNKLRQLQLSELEEKSRLETQLQNVKNELKLVKENKEKDIRMLKEKCTAAENENAVLKSEKVKLMNEIGNRKLFAPQIKLLKTLPSNASSQKKEQSFTGMLQQPEFSNKSGLSSTKSSTSANKVEQELFPSANIMYLNTSTPMINPDAVLSQDKILSAAPVPQPRQESYPVNFEMYDNKENVGAKPEEQPRQNLNEEIPGQGVLRAPDILNDFRHVPAVQEYKDKLKQGLEKNNGGEVGDEGEPLVKNHGEKEKRVWRGGEIEGLPFERLPAGNEIPKNEVYQYQAEYEAKKEEGEDDDDVDPVDYQHVNEKIQEQEKRANVGAHVKIPLEDKRESVMIQPK